MADCNNELFSRQGMQSVLSVYECLQSFKLYELRWTSVAQTLNLDYKNASLYFKTGVKKCEILRNTTAGLFIATGAAVLATTIATGGLALMAAGAAGVFGVSGIFSSSNFKERTQNLLKHTCDIACRNHEAFVEATAAFRKSTEDIYFMACCTATIGDCDKFSGLFTKTVDFMKKCEALVGSRELQDAKFLQFQKVLAKRVNAIDVLRAMISDVTAKVQKFYTRATDAEKLLTTTVHEFNKQHKKDYSLITSENITSPRITKNVQYDVVQELLGKISKLETEISRIQVQDRACIVCMDHNSDVVFLPCKHFNSCNMCATQLQSCPVCRVKIKEKLLVYIQ